MSALIGNDIGATAHSGIITSIDPKNYKVKVLLSILQIETDWIRVISPYVGQGWGIVALPHVGNEALVIFLNGELNDGVVIGCLYSENVDHPPESAQHPAIVHETGSRIVLNHDGSIIIEAKTGLYLRGAQVHLNDDR